MQTSLKALHRTQPRYLASSTRVGPFKRIIQNRTRNPFCKGSQKFRHTSSFNPTCSPSGQFRSFAIMEGCPKTKLVFQAAEHQETTTHETKLLQITAYDDLHESDKALFKNTAENADHVYVIVTESTIFHPQGGGQPSDVGQMKLGSAEAVFTVFMVKPSAHQTGVVLHFGTFGQTIATPSDLVHMRVEQTVDGEKRKLFSRYHTAGHVLGSATRNLLESKIENFDELKASHFPDAASCEFQGSIDGKYKAELQNATDELVTKDVEVRIEWWTKSDFRHNSLTRLMPTDKIWTEIAVSVDEHGVELPDAEASRDDEKTRIRVVNIVGAEIYPCGGTHVKTTKGCGKVTVRKISRQKGNSRVSYAVD